MWQLRFFLQKLVCVFFTLGASALQNAGNRQGIDAEFEDDAHEEFTDEVPEAVNLMEMDTVTSNKVDTVKNKVVVKQEVNKKEATTNKAEKKKAEAKKATASAGEHGKAAHAAAATTTGNGGRIESQMQQKHASRGGPKTAGVPVEQ
ncbi:unnamed protein product [Amoebophrya sp. A120]|nr:unnamed protein product [Amoebophrya sp. A120]|eukprot:GSA120T00014580001.1